MAPFIRHHNYLLICRGPWMNYQKGQLVLVNHSYYRFIIERIEAVKNQQFLLSGENIQSISTEDMGWITEQDIIGRLVWHISESHNNT